jgi:hypothetical protein
MRDAPPTMIDLPPLARSGPLPRAGDDFIREGLRRGGQVSCFHYVPSNYDAVWCALDALPRTRFCEWGSGLGIATGIAELLGFDAYGIERDAPLAEQSRELLADFGLKARIECGDYMELSCPAKLYFVYCWPGQVLDTERYFAQVADSDAELLMYHGPKKIRRIAKTSSLAAG